MFKKILILLTATVMLLSVVSSAMAFDGSIA